MHPLRGAKLGVLDVTSFAMGNLANLVFIGVAGILAFGHGEQHTFLWVAEVIFIPLGIYWAMYVTGFWDGREFWFSDRPLKLFLILTVGLMVSFVFIGLTAQAHGFEEPWAFASFLTATDPIGVGIAISLLPPQLVYIRGMAVQLEQESGWNDGIALVLLALVTGSGTLMENGIGGLKGLSIALFIGLLVAVIHTLLRDKVRRSQSLGVKSEVVTITVILLPLCIIAKVMGSSSVLVTVIGAGVGNIFAALRAKNLDPEEEHAVHEAWESLSQLANFVVLFALGFIMPWQYMLTHPASFIMGAVVVAVIVAARTLYVFGKRISLAVILRRGFGMQYKDILVPMLNVAGGVVRIGIAGLIGIPWFAYHGYTHTAAIMAATVLWSLLATVPTVIIAILAERHGAERYEPHPWKGLPRWLVDHIRRLPDDVRPIH